MNRHLREEDICRWIAGQRGPDTERHLENCGLCRSHVARMNETLAGFESMVRDRSKQRLAGQGAFPLDISVASQNRRGWGKLPVVALLTALVILLAAVAAWLPWHAPQSQAVGVRPAAAPAADDAALLTRVDAEVSRTVPGPMEPLTALIEWRPESRQAAQSPLDRGSGKAQQD